VDIEALFERLYPALYRHVHRLTGDPDVADDVAQEAFVRLLNQSLPENEARPWLYTVAMNLVRDGARKAERTQRLRQNVPTFRDVDPAPDEVMERGREVAAVRAVLDGLPERDRVLLLMREEGFRYDEIARAVGVAPSSVGTLLARAMKRFAAAYRRNEEVDDARI
jgi:RNA polymerase sigma-70 factor (ECF subfamily)